MSSILFIALFLIPALWAMRKDFPQGLAVSLVLFLTMSNGLHVDGLGGGFDLTFHRLLLLAVVAFWLSWRSRRDLTAEVPFARILLLWFATNLLSLILAKDFALSLKWFVTFCSEFVLFYIIMASVLTDSGAVEKAYRAICWGTSIIAVLGTIEYYTLFNPFIEWLKIPQPKDENDVLVGFKHRILFGYAMAMGWPLLLAAAHRQQSRGTRRIYFLLTVLTLSACYFSGSRGPWFAAALGGGLLFMLGSPQMRRSITIFALLSLVVVILRPGVRDTLVDLVSSTFDKDSYRGRSYYYRKELWPVAISLANASIERGLFGYGGLSTETMDLSGRFQFGGSTYHTGFSSWDNNYAADLVEFGYLGLGVEIFFYAIVLLEVGRWVWRCAPGDRDRPAAVFAAIAVFVFSLTNVYMFSPQIKFMFASLVIIGARLRRVSQQEADLQARPVEAESLGGTETVSQGGALAGDQLSAEASRS
jgi:hypothetical protein